MAAITRKPDTAEDLFGLLKLLSQGKFYDSRERETLLRAAIVKSRELTEELRRQANGIHEEDPTPGRQLYAGLQVVDCQP